MHDTLEGAVGISTGVAEFSTDPSCFFLSVFCRGRIPRANCKIWHSGPSALIDERAIRSKGETMMEKKNETESYCAGCACAPGACACGQGVCGCGPSCTCAPCTCPSE